MTQEFFQVADRIFTWVLIPLLFWLIRTWRSNQDQIARMAIQVTSVEAKVAALVKQNRAMVHVIAQSDNGEAAKRLIMSLDAEISL